jgi:class 3 adenylate cyclase/predicted ATPase
MAAGGTTVGNGPSKIITAWLQLRRIGSLALGAYPMLCLKCMAENRAARRFCAQCGTPLPLQCSVCGFENEPAVRFCGGCGKPVEGGAAPAPPSSWPPARADNAERRQLTVMFCDLVGSTELASRLDPEDMQEVINAYHRAVAGMVTAFDGSVGRYMGDGVLVYFGYPRAHEDDAERAVRAGLAVIDAVSRLDTKCVKLQARVGIATGLVVVGDLIGEGPAQEQSVVGETPNLAARLQMLAEPDAVVIAAATRRLVGDLFDYRALGEVEIKGISGLAAVWQVLWPSGVESRFKALRGSSLSPLIGRDEEIDLILRRWVRAKAGNGQIVLIAGEPGIGKSRIVAELEERLRVEPHLRLRYFCSPYRQNSALFPVIDHLGRAAGFARDDPPAAELNKLKALLASSVTPQEDMALLADLLSLPALEPTPLPSLSPQRKKERTIEALLHQLEGSAAREPVVMVFEDVHWIDPTSRELLDFTVERIRSLPVLLIVTFRPEFQPPWIGQPRVTMLALNRLDQRDRTALVEQIAGGKALPNDVVTQIADRTDGVPLFVEELTKSVLESGLLREESDRYILDGALPPFAIPASLHDSLLARLDRLCSLKLVAQIGAAIGREFSYMLLRAVSRLSDAELVTALDRLVASELVFQRGTPPDAVYAFKHALVQDTAYSSLLRGSRRQLHAHIAEALQNQFPELMHNQSELLAQHYGEAGLTTKSASCWSEAGHRSVSRSAMAEAAAQFRKALDQLMMLPDNPERRRKELELWSALGAVLNAVKGAAAPETGEAYTRARELWEQLDCPSEFLQVPFGQSRYHLYRGQFELAQPLAEDLLRMSRNRNDYGALILGHFSSGRNLMFVGRLASARSHLEEVVAVYDPVSQPALVHQAGTHPHINSKAYLGIVLFCLGFPGEALEQSNSAIAEARRLAHPPSLAASLSLGAILLSLDGNDALFGRRADELAAVATEQSFPYWRAQGAAYRGWVKVKAGDVAEGISLLRSGLSAFRGTGAEMWMSYYTALLARAYEIAGEIEDSLAVSNDALQIVEGTGELWFAAELNRYKGQLLQRQGHSEAAEELYRKALSIAVEQGAKLWELRAAATLARLRLKQGRLAEAHDLLAPIYGWFTQDFDRPDLQEAKVLLETLIAALSAQGPVRV